MTGIHIKESVVRALPNIFHPLTPPLFIEQGSMPCHDKKKSKSAVIYINLCGVYFIRPISLSKKYKLSQFISTYDITKIDYQDKTQCEIYTRSKSLYIHCEHCEDAVSAILSSRELLFKDMKQVYQIELTNFPYTPPAPTLLIQPDISIITLRYIAMCSKRSFIPQGRILDVFNKFSPTHHVTLTLDEFCIAPPTVKNLLYPIFTFKHIQILRLNNFSPYFVCRFLHHLIKHGFKAQTIIMEGYSHIIPEQLRMENTHGYRPLNLIFKNCNFSDDINERLFTQLGKYPGEISRLSFINYSLTNSGWKSLFDTVTQCRPFKEMESFEINNVSSSQLYEDQVPESIKALLKHCRFIMKLSISNWSQPIHYGINNFQNYLLLSEINLSGQDMTQPLPDDFKMLRMVHCLNLSNCNFTFNSLQSLFKTLSTARTQFAIRLADIKLPDSHWRNFYSSLSSFPPLSSLCELDWSGNHLFNEDINNFAKYFFNGTKLKYLQIDRIFNSQQADDLYNLLYQLSDKGLLGISVGGSSETNFSGNLKSLLRSIELLMNLHILRLDGQKITELDTVALVDYLKVQRTLNDVSFDDTSINDQQRFFDFYRDVCNLDIDAVGRPFKDLNRLFGSDLSMVINPSHYDEFQSLIRLKSDKILDSCRQFYFCKFMGTSYDPKVYQWFGQCYPQTFLDEGRYDTFGLKKENQKSSMPTLCAIAHKTLLRTLEAYHQRYLSIPDRMPRYRATLDTFQPTFLADPNNQNDQSYAYLNQDTTYDGDLTQTGHFGFGFGTIIGNQNLDDLYATTTYDTQQFNQFDQQPVYDQNEQFDAQQFDTQQFDQQQFDQQQFDQPQYDSQQQFDNIGAQNATQNFDQQNFDQSNKFDQQQFDQTPKFQSFEPNPQYDQQQFDQSPQFQQQFDQTPQFKQFDNQQFDNQQFDNQQFDNQQFDNQQFDNQQYNNQQFDNQQFDQQDFTPQFQQEFAFNQDPQFIPQPEINVYQFDQQNSNHQFSQQQFNQPQFDQLQNTPQFISQEQHNPLIQQGIQPQNALSIDQQQQSLEPQQSHRGDFSKTLNRFVSHGNIEYEENAPELPSLRSDINIPKQTGEVTDIKPLLQSTIKPRDKSIEQPANIPPPLLPVSSGSADTSSSAFFVPPPSETGTSGNNLNFPPAFTSQPFIPAPVPIQPIAPSNPAETVSAQQTSSPHLIPPPQYQSQAQAQPQQVQTQSIEQPPLIEKITVIPPPQLNQQDQIQLQQEQQPVLQEPSAPQYTVEKTVSVTQDTVLGNQPYNNTQNTEKAQAPSLSSGISPPPVFIPPPNYIVPPPDIKATPISAGITTTTTTNEQEPAQVTPTQVSPNQVTPTQVSPNQVTPTQVTPTQVTPTQVTPTQVSPNQVAPNQVAPTQVTSNQYTSSQFTPAQGAPNQQAPTLINPASKTSTTQPPADLRIPAPTNLAPHAQGTANLQVPVPGDLTNASATKHHSADLPAAPSRKKKTSGFHSAAGSLRLLSSAGLGNTQLPPTKRSVKVNDGKLVEFPDQTTLQAPQPLPERKSFEDIDIPDLAVTSNAASRQEIPKLIVIDNPASIDSFYQTDKMPFELPKPIGQIPVGKMSHPLQSRVFLKPPNITILGVPNEW